MLDSRYPILVILRADSRLYAAADVELACDFCPARPARLYEILKYLICDMLVEYTDIPVE